ncbi:hypothetical protein DNU06_12360 [Putridiphycobacter roseus]|uniref:Uncharacterized protein n=1 Tax=Putridiphycobacter roseus TaxID=2219161 RepID=A0A2W1N158_9FLAO|nr:hypothetical protein [Putridiphycobacter roseus]PZE16641.1 hypothetical protein DNU06_12360 [Putridiphycobacter roseus]
MKITFLLVLLFPFFAMTQTSNITLGDSTIQLVKAFNAPASKVLFFNMHEDEQTSIEVSKAFGQGHAINFVYLHHQLTRRVFYNVGKREFSIDPNRIYTKKGRRKTIAPWRPFAFKANNEAAKLANTILSLIKPFKTIVTMHNNTDVEYTIKSYLPEGEEAKNTADIHVSDKWDADDFVYTTSVDFFHHLKAADVNVILQDNVKFVNDGSLSVFCGINGIDYLNIEAQKGHFDAQLKLTEIVYHMLMAH